MSDAVEEKPKKKKRVKDQYYTLPEEEIQEMLVKAKAGDTVTQSFLLQKFDPFLSKYVNLLFYGTYDIGNYDMRRFISLFVTDANVRMYLKRNKLNEYGRHHVNETMGRICGMVQRYCDEEDVRQTINMTFLNCVMRYKRTKSKRGGWVPFSGFLYSYFFYMVKKDVDVYLIDQLGRKTFPLIDDEDWGEEEDETQPGYTAPPEPSAEEMFGPEEIDEDWVLGDTALPPFDDLTIQQRQLIKWRYVDGLKSSDIAQRITEHPNTVREHFNKIRMKINESLVEVID